MGPKCELDFYFALDANQSKRLAKLIGKISSGQVDDLLDFLESLVKANGQKVFKSLVANATIHSIASHFNVLPSSVCAKRPFEFGWSIRYIAIHILCDKLGMGYAATGGAMGLSPQTVKRGYLEFHGDPKKYSSVFLYADVIMPNIPVMISKGGWLD